MSAQDKKQIEKVNARNAVEEYVYEMRDKLEDVYREFISEAVRRLTNDCVVHGLNVHVLQDKESFLKLLTATEDWLYEEGEDETKSVYVAKLEELKVRKSQTRTPKHTYTHSNTHTAMFLFTTIRKLVTQW